MNTLKFLEGTDGEKAGKAASGINFLFAALGFLIACLGLIVACCKGKCCKGKCCICTYGLFALVFGIIFLVFGIVFTYIVSYSSQILEDFCANKTVSSINLNAAAGQIDELDFKMRNYSATYMCTNVCPCPTSLNLEKWNNDITYPNNRTTNYTGEFVDGNYFEGFIVSENNTQTSFWNCYQYARQLDKEYAEQTNTARKIEDIPEGQEDLLRRLEEEYDCMGICQKGMFRFFKDVTEGPPTQTCLEGMKNELEKWPLAVGITLLVQCVLTLIAFITSYGLCCSSGKDD